ncbi:MAG: hypothetical protein AAF721_28425 [Myxococcota bacterium]
MRRFDGDWGRRGWRAVACAQAIAVALVALPAHAAPESVLENPEARAHFEAAQEAFENEDYAAAIPDLKAAYALEGNPLLLYAWAQAERFSGNCKRALELYKQYLDRGPNDEQRRLAEANIADCQAEVGGTDPDPPPKDPTDPTDPSGNEDTSTAPATTGATDTPPGGKPWYKDWLAPTLAGAGLLAAGGGGALIALGVRQGRDAPTAVNEMDYFEEGDAARAKHTAGWVLVGVGGALVVGAAIRYALLAAGVGKGGKKTARVLPGFGGRSAGLSVRF